MPVANGAAPRSFAVRPLRIAAQLLDVALMSGRCECPDTEISLARIAGAQSVDVEIRTGVE
jgi:hypothetical protein